MLTTSKRCQLNHILTLTEAADHAVMRPVVKIYGALCSLPVEHAEIHGGKSPPAVVALGSGKNRACAFSTYRLTKGLARRVVVGVGRGAHDADNSAFVVENGVCTPEDNK